MNLSKLLSDAGFEYRAVGSTDIEISEIVSDSRRVCDNCLFLCIRGIKNDSHRYIGEVCAHGAAALVVEEGHAAEAVHPPAGITIIYTKDTRSALARLWYSRYELAAAGMRIVAVTGTNGKTTVSYMLRSIFGAAMHRCGLIGNNNLADGKVLGFRDILQLIRICDELNFGKLQTLSVRDPCHFKPEVTVFRRLLLQLITERGEVYISRR